MRFLRVCRYGLAFVALVLGAAEAAHAQLEPSPAFTALAPGEFVVRRHDVPIRLVFIGYGPHDIDEQALLDELPAGYVPQVQAPLWYGLSGRDMGLEYRFDYELTYADAAFEEAFFGFLRGAGTSGEPTLFQTQYNDQLNNVLDVGGPVLYIDGPSVEKYLEEHLAFGEDGYTLVFINWFGREDFSFHVYTKTDQPDPDTGFNFGAELQSRKGIAWGGSHGRTWFYDLSAGPESWTNNWIVDDDQTEYHMPPIWEYSAQGYRDASQLSTDLGLVTRFVGIDLLFTTSPIYDPLFTAPEVGGSKVVHLTLLEDNPESSGLGYFDSAFTLEKLSAFEPYYAWQLGSTHVDPIDLGAKRALDIFAELIDEPDCWSQYGDTFAQLFCYFDQNLGRYVPEYPKRDSVNESFAFNTSEAALGTRGLLGFADDNWVDGTQTYSFIFDTPEDRASGYGFTITEVHELGHIIGMSHPHDGYDSELGLELVPEGGFEFIWVGDESDSVMHYFDVSGGFGQFDRDNLYRWEAAGYLNWANALLGDVLDHPHADPVAADLVAAEAAAARALAAFDAWDYLTAATEAHGAYGKVAKAAEQLRLISPALVAARERLPGRGVERRVCTKRFPGI
jgi:hypothetical protein